MGRVGQPGGRGSTVLAGTSACGCEAPGQAIHGCSGHVDPFILENGEKPTSGVKEPGGGAACIRRVGLPGTHGSCLAVYPSPLLT